MNPNSPDQPAPPRTGDPPAGVDQPPPRRVCDLYRLAAGWLRSKRVPEAENLAAILISERTGIPRLRLMASDQSLDASLLEPLRRDLRRLAHGEPIQYLLGTWPFRDLDLLCDPRALIPRPETEQLVDHILALPLPQEMRFADLGTGTGAIGLSLLQARPKASAILTDCSPDALDLARENAHRLGLASRATFALADAFVPAPPASLDLLVSNPPYIETAELQRLPPHIRLHEPALALDGGKDGLDCYRRIIPNALMPLKPGGFIAFEIGSTQARPIAKLLDLHGFSRIRTIPDFNRLDRFLIAQLP